MLKSSAYLLLVTAFLLAGCASRQDKGLSCTSSDCRPQSSPHQLVIWWQPDLRNNAADYTQVSVNE
ncbi:MULTISPECIES: HrpT family type III secretion system protein [Pantoea]|uniref:HrpT family type III secretion system protein n=1 Tax=Pantoea TaxID=53335 RepID=UPI00105EA9BF|nr:MULTISPECIES: HrpT family type III secretion system protein [Pantoea]UYK99752.1 type III secretion protein HrpT [Pantoea stewartii]